METGDPLTLALAENARITIYNGTSTSGLAESTRDFFTSQGLNVIEATSAAEAYSYTTLVVHSATPYALDYLARIMQVPGTRVFNQYDPESTTDITVFLGNDWATTNPMQ